MQVLDYIILGLKIIAGVVAIPAVGGWLVAKIDALIVNTKDMRRKMMLEWLKEGMVFVQKEYTGGTKQKAELQNLIDNRLQANHWTKNFTGEQIEQLLEATFVELKSKGLV